MFILEGNIGSGKSTFLKLIKNFFPLIKTEMEPLESWQEKVDGQSILKKFYQDPKRWAFTLENLILVTRVKEHIKDQKLDYEYSIIERSLYSGYYCFAKNSHESGFLTDIEWKIYTDWFEFLVPDYCKSPKGFIYLQSDPKKCFERMKKRNREDEGQISFEYLQQMHDKHEDFLIRKIDVIPELKTIPVLVINADIDFEHNTDKQKEIFEKTIKFMQDIIKL